MTMALIAGLIVPAAAANAQTINRNQQDTFKDIGMGFYCTLAGFKTGNQNLSPKVSHDLTYTFDSSGNKAVNLTVAKLNGTVVPIQCNGIVTFSIAFTVIKTNLNNQIACHKKDYSETSFSAAAWKVIEGKYLCSQAYTSVTGTVTKLANYNPSIAGKQVSINFGVPKGFAPYGAGFLAFARTNINPFGERALTVGLQ